MKLRYKVIIFMAAVLVTLLGFNLMSSSSVCLLDIGKKAGYEIIGNYLGKAEHAEHDFCYIKS
jgi:hypothetical protein